MNYQEGVRQFRDSAVGLNNKDLPAIREAWCVFIDTLHRNGEITDKQAQDWCLPSGFSLPPLPSPGQTWAHKSDDLRVLISCIEGRVIYFNCRQRDYAQDVRQFMQNYVRVQ